MKISVTSDIERAIRGLDRLAREQVPYAASRAINETAKLAVADGNAEIRSVFDRPQPRTATAVKVFRGATKQRLEAIVNIHDGEKGYALDDPRAMASRKGSIFPNRYLAAQIEGGKRVNKRFENALIAKGVMPRGMQAVPGEAAQLDAFGNMRGSQLVQILAYFEAFPAVPGYKANMSKEGRGKLARGTKARRGFVYFLGRPGGGQLPLGIWQRFDFGALGTAIKPVLLFVQPGTYQKRFDFYGVMQRSVDRHLPVQFQKAMQLALATAR